MFCENSYPEASGRVNFTIKKSEINIENRIFSYILKILNTDTL